MVSTLTATTDYRFPRFLPSVILLKLDHGAQSRVYSLIANRGEAAGYLDLCYYDLDDSVY